MFRISHSEKILNLGTTAGEEAKKMGDILKARAEPAEGEKKKIRQAINIRTYREIKILMKRLT